MERLRIVFAILLAVPGALAAASCAPGPESIVLEDQERGDPDEQEYTGEAREDFSPSVFRFVTQIPDDGQDEGGGWQIASTVLRFFDWRERLIPKEWTCTVKVGMPIRAQAYGPISPGKAANLTAGVATDASMEVMHSRADWVPAAYCIAFVDQMRATFRTRHPSLGATVTRQ